MPFRYWDPDNLAVIGHNAAVADLGTVRFDGFAAWLLWLLIHIYYLIGFENKLLVMIQWGWNYVTRTRGAQLITGNDPSLLVEPRAGTAGDVRLLGRICKLGGTEYLPESYAPRRLDQHAMGAADAAAPAPTTNDRAAGGRPSPRPQWDAVGATPRGPLAG
jgi:hypothetical protein